MEDIVRADSRLAPSQWETSLQSNDVSHWLGAILESALITCNHYHAADALLASMVLIGFDGNIPPSAPEWLITCVYFIPPKLELCITFFVIPIMSFPPISLYHKLISDYIVIDMHQTCRLTLDLSLSDNLSKLYIKHNAQAMKSCLCHHINFGWQFINTEHISQHRIPQMC